MRSYDSRAEPPPEYDCTIWEAGRATCAIGLAFKGIQIGQYMFHDDGGGTFNPTPHALDEAVCNEWPGREVGVCVSVGTGKRPKNSEINQALWYEGLLGEFAEARKRLIAKIEGCEKIHEYVKREHLAKRGVNIENYYRFNVEVGVGEYGMNEWNRLADISTSTRQYLSSDSERQAMHSAASKLAKIAFAKQRMDRLPDVPELHRITPTPGVAMDSISSPLAAELPAEIPSSWPPPSAQAPPPLPSRRARTPPSRSSYESGTGPDHLSVPGDGPSTPSPRTSGERLTVVSPGAGGSNHAPNASPGSHSDPGAKRPTPTQAPGSAGSRPPPMPPRTGGAGRSAGGSPRIGSSDGGNGSNSHSNDADRLTVEAPTPEEYRTGVLGGAGRAAPPPPPPPPPPHPPVPGSGPYGYHVEPPPRPPKTPLIDGHEAMSRRPIPQQKHQHQQQVLPPPGALPYPLDDDELPPPVPAVGKKPEFRGR